MKQKIKKIVSIGLICLILNYSILVYSAYQEALHGEGTLQPATPQIRLVYVTSPIETFGPYLYGTEFQIVNYAGYNEITQVDLAYTLSIRTEPANVPFHFKLYQLDSNWNKHEVPLTSTFTFNANQKQEHYYRLESSYSLPDAPVKENIGIWVDLDIVQIR